MNREEFINYIESIGFKSSGGWYTYKNHMIYLYGGFYVFLINNKTICKNVYTYITPLNEHFKKELRSIKIKQLLR